MLSIRKTFDLDLAEMVLFWFNEKEKHKWNVSESKFNWIRWKWNLVELNRYVYHVYRLNDAN